MDNIISKLKYIFENNVNVNDILLSCLSDNQLYTLSLDKNMMNIIKYFKIDNDLRYNLYKFMLNNLIDSDIINTKIFKNQTWELYVYNCYIGCISNILAIKYNYNYFNKSENRRKIVSKNIYLEHHNNYNKMIQDISFYIKRNNVVNNYLNDNLDINGFYYIDKLNCYNIKDNNLKKEENIKFKTENKKITKKITDYFV